MKPLDPTSIVMRWAWRVVWHLASRWAYLACFLSVAVSIPGIVSSTRMMDWSLQMTMSGLLSVVATSWGKQSQAY